MNIWLLTSDPDAAAFQPVYTQLKRLGTVTLLAPSADSTSVPGRFISRQRFLHPNSRQHPDDPAFPYTVMAAELALSYEIADTAEVLLASQGTPDVVVCVLDQALPYFVLQRRLTNLSQLVAVPVAVVAIAPRCVQAADRQSRFLMPGYWLERLEQFCLRAADAIIGVDSNCCDQIRTTVPQLAMPILLPDQLARFLEQITPTYQPRIRFPSNSAQGNSLSPSAEETPGVLSVVVPFYNLGQYIGEALSSLVTSTYRPLEVIIVDDGSRPEQRALLDQAVAQYADVLRIISQPNSGLARARNAGAEAARGEFLAFCDADDTVMPEYFTKAIAVLQRHTNVSFVSAWVQLFGTVDACVPTWNPEFPFLLGRNMLLEQVVLRRADFLAYGRNDPTIAYAFEDHETWIRMHAAGCVGVNIPEVLASYRVRHDSMLRSANRKVQYYLMELIMQRHAGLYQQYGAELFALQNANGSALDWNQPSMPTEEYRLRAEQAEASYNQLRRRLTILDPLVQFVRRLKRLQ
jgi:Glycosyl transferase family 2